MKIRTIFLVRIDSNAHFCIEDIYKIIFEPIVNLEEFDTFKLLVYLEEFDTFKLLRRYRHCIKGIKITSKNVIEFSFEFPNRKILLKFRDELTPILNKMRLSD